MERDSDIEQKEGIRYIQDILKEVAEEEDFTEKEVKEVWRLHKKYLESLMDDPEVISISIPFVGTLYFNTFISKDIVKRNRAKDLSSVISKEEFVREEVTKDIADCRERGITMSKYPQTRKGGIYRIYRLILKSIGIEKRGSYGKHRKVIDTIEEYSTKQIVNE